jgi:hypothetical protein
MGYHITIQQSVSICRKTGKPYYIGPNCEVIYGFQDITVPEEHRRFLHEKNTVYHAYKPSESVADAVDTVYADFPSWEYVQEQFGGKTSDYEWTEEDHKAFYAALEWFASHKSCYFVVFWG